VDPLRAGARSELAVRRDDRPRVPDAALAPALLEQVLPLGGYALVVNYGLDRVP
jgi:hypothetical protein